MQRTCRFQLLPQSFVLFLQLHHLYLVSILYRTDLLVQPLELASRCYLVLECIIKFIRYPLSGQPSTSLLPIILIDSYSFPQLLLNSLLLNQPPIQFLILNIQLLNSSHHPLRLQLPKFLLILLRSITNIIILAALNLSNGTWIIHKILTNDYNTLLMMWYYIYGVKIATKRNDENIYHWNHSRRKN